MNDQALLIISIMTEKCLEKSYLFLTWLEFTACKDILSKFYGIRLCFCDFLNFCETPHVCCKLKCMWYLPAVADCPAVGGWVGFVVLVVRVVVDGVLVVVEVVVVVDVVVVLGVVGGGVWGWVLWAKQVTWSGKSQYPDTSLYSSPGWQVDMRAVPETHI